MTNTKEYRAWENMRKRCYNPRSVKFVSYGARGIFVCEQWRTSFQQFFADMGPAPSDGHSIERIDNNGPYAPENCKWIPLRDQAANQRKTIRLTHNNKTMSLSAWAREIGMDRGCLQARIDNGWPIYRALTTPSNPSNKPNHVMMTLYGKTQPMAAWCRELGIRKAMVAKRLARGLSDAEALLTPSRKA